MEIKVKTILMFTTMGIRINPMRQIWWYQKWCCWQRLPNSRPESFSHRRWARPCKVCLYV